MAIEVKVPNLGESITEAQIGRWLKAEGDPVEKDESLVVLESEKAAVEVPAPESGRLARILHQPGETIPVGTTIAHLEPNGAEQPHPPPDQATAPPADPPATPAPKKDARNRVRKSKASGPPPEIASGAYDLDASHALPVELRDEEPASQPAPADTAGEAPEGTAPPAQSPAAPRAPTAAASPERQERAVPMSMLRRTVARRLVEAQQTMAMVTTFNEIDMSAVQNLRHEHQEAFQKRYSARLGLMSFFVKAAVAALNEFPQLNAEVRGDDIVYRNYFDIGIAIAAPRGLVVPVLADAARLSFAGIESRIGDFAARAKDGKLKPEELGGGTFTITNGGTFGSLLSTPVINPPQSGILGLHSIVERPIAVQSAVVIRPMMYVALTYDHRIVDGREGVLFLKRIKEVIENPSRILLEI
jgi:2-oxoglutarate dehydrogenase E2 component (dihydrolipoamide succinyltransferase)